MAVDPDLDLVFERDLPVPPAAVWRCWTEPALLMQWFTPAPWRTTACDIDLRPGSAFRTIIQGPDAPKIHNTGSFLEVVPHERLVWTNAKLPGFRPPPDERTGFLYSVAVAQSPAGAGTRYRASPPARVRCSARSGYRYGCGC